MDNDISIWARPSGEFRVLSRPYLRTLLTSAAVAAAIALAGCNLSDVTSGRAQAPLSEKMLADITAKSFEDSFHFNVTTALVLTQACIPQLVANRGSVVNISSMAGRTAARGLTQYGVAKAAMTHMTRYLATDLNPKVRVNAIAVGSTATSALETILTVPEIRDAMIEATPLRVIAEPEDIALGVLYLASSAARYVTGKIIEIDGGTESSTFELPIPDL